MLTADVIIFVADPSDTGRPRAPSSQLDSVERRRAHQYGNLRALVAPPAPSATAKHRTVRAAAKRRRWDGWLGPECAMDCRKRESDHMHIDDGFVAIGARFLYCWNRAEGSELHAIDANAIAMASIISRYANIVLDPVELTKIKCSHSPREMRDQVLNLRYDNVDSVTTALDSVKFFTIDKVGRSHFLNHLVEIV